MRIYIHGATGTVGSLLARQLADDGHTVLAGTRSPRPPQRGVEYVDSRNPALVAEVEAVFLIPPMNMVGDEYRHLKPFLDEARSSRPGKVVLVTGIGEEKEDNEARRFELELLDSGLNATILRPNWFMDNFHRYFAAAVRDEAKLYFPGGDGRVSFIDARDVSATAAAILTGGGYAGEGLTLTGPEALDHHQVAEKISAAVGRRIEYVDAEPHAFQADAVSAGLIEGNVDTVVHTEEIRRGDLAFLTDTVREVLGRDPLSFDQYVAAYRDWFVA